MTEALFQTGFGFSDCASWPMEQELERRLLLEMAKEPPQ
jgi:hypothetical protein